jgi:hypothetical protein
LKCIQHTRRIKKQNRQQFFGRIKESVTLSGDTSFKIMKKSIVDQNGSFKKTEWMALDLFPSWFCNTFAKET